MVKPQQNPPPPSHQHHLALEYSFGRGLPSLLPSLPSSLSYLNILLRA